MERLYSEILETAAEAARKAGTFIREARAEGLHVDAKSRIDFVSDKDIQYKVRDFFGKCGDLLGEYLRISLPELKKRLHDAKARGVILRNGKSIEELYAEREKLYSQYAERRTTLSGEAQLPTGGVKAYTEQNQGDKLFLMQGEVMDTIADTSEVTIVELRPDEYDKAD